MRFWEIDALRGIAVVMMIIFHFLFDLNLFANYTFNISSGFWFFFARITASIFILLVGVSLTISYSRNNSFIKHFKRGLKIFSLGLVITAVTFFYFRSGFIVFGILHFIGISIILGYFLLRYDKINIFIGALLIALGIILQGFVFDFPWLLWLGLFPSGFYTFDYFPLLPWFGLLIIGMFFGKMLYRNGKRIFRIKENSTFIARLLCFLGRHSLIIYLLHQPILVLFIHILI